MNLGEKKSIKKVGKWSLKGQWPREEALTRFFLLGGPKDARQPGKIKGLERSWEVGGGELIMHVGDERKREGRRGAKPFPVGH